MFKPIEGDCMQMNINQYTKSCKPLLIYTRNRDIYMVYGILDGNLVIWQWWIHMYHDNTHDLQAHKIIEWTLWILVKCMIKCYESQKYMYTLEDLS